MFKKIDFKGLNYKELDRFGSHDLKRDTLHSFYQTFDFLELIKKWPDIVGPMLSPVTSPLKIQSDALFIIAKHASYSHNLSFLTEEIKSKIFLVLPELKPVIKKLVFQTQENFFNRKESEDMKKAAIEKPKLHPQSPQYKMLMLEAERLFGDIPDAELKSLMISIFVQSR